MSLPQLKTQRSFFDIRMMTERLFQNNGAQRFVFFADKIWPKLLTLRSELARMYCEDNGRPAEEPVRMLGALILQFMERLPDRSAAETCQYDLRWKLALSMEADEKGFHPTSLVKFRERLLEHGLERLGFEAVLEQMKAEGYLPKRSKQRLDSTHIIGLVSRMSRLECVRETLRLALEELEQAEQLSRPAAWSSWWERYKESSLDYKNSGEVLQQKMVQAGQDTKDLLSWIKGLAESIQRGNAIQLLQRVFNENFEISDCGAVEKRRAQPTGAVHNPHNPEAQWSTKSTTKDKEWVGHKVQVAETVEENPKQKGEPTRGVITAIVTQDAPESDKAGMAAVLEEQEQLGLEKPPTLYVDGAYVCGPTLAEAQKQGRELMGPAPSSPDRGKTYPCEAFQVEVEARRAVCPGGKVNTQCSRLVEHETGKVNYRFEWASQCQGCELRPLCVSEKQSHRTLVVGEHHTLLQARRQVMPTELFQKQMRYRNGIESTQSELVRGYGLRKARYRGLKKVRLQNFMIGVACNTLRWFRHTAWDAQQAAKNALRTLEIGAVA
jgi:transposase